MGTSYTRPYPVSYEVAIRALTSIYNQNLELWILVEYLLYPPVVAAFPRRTL